jgi:hypothetical protein
VRVVMQAALIGLATGMAIGAAVATVQPVPVESSGATSTVADALAGPGPFTVGQLVRTGAGAIRVTSVDSVQARTVVTMRIVNDTGHAVRFGAGEVELTRTGAAPVTGEGPEATVPAGASAQATVAFSGPATGELWLPGATAVLLG